MLLHFEIRAPQRWLWSKVRQNFALLDPLCNLGDGLSPRHTTHHCQSSFWCSFVGRHCSPTLLWVPTLSVAKMMTDKTATMSANNDRLCIAALGEILELIFTALHVMQTRYSEENSVRLSVRHTRDPWQNGREICPDFYTIRKNIYLTFLRRRMVGGGRPLLGEILGQPTPIRAKSPIFNQ